MGIVNEAPIAPDTFGLQEYFVTEIFTEIAGSNVRMVCGVKRSGIVHWLYSCVMPAEVLLPSTSQCADAAKEAFGLLQLMDRRGKGH